MLRPRPIPAFTDNYIWALEAEEAPAVVIVDPGEARPVLRDLAHRGLRLAAVLLTHHHGDHVDGVAEIVRLHPAPVYGPKNERIAAVTHPLSEGDRIDLDPIDMELEVLDVPGHTAGHIAYHGEGFVMVGDLLFAGGCGRVFEGTSRQMYESLQKVAALPRSTEIYCAHEYTLSNLGFALVIEPESSALKARFEEVRAIRASQRPSVPSTLGVELITNPFLRCTDPAIVTAAERHAKCKLSPGAEVFAEIRAWKDGWRG